MNNIFVIIHCIVALGVNSKAGLVSHRAPSSNSKRERNLRNRNAQTKSGMKSPTRKKRLNIGNPQK